jgi:hypothetical protein
VRDFPSAKSGRVGNADGLRIAYDAGAACRLRGTDTGSRHRTLKALEANNLITRSSSRSITIGDWKKLAEAGDFDSNYLHLKDDEPALD